MDPTNQPKRHPDQLAALPECTFRTDGINNIRLTGSYFAPTPMAAVSQMKWSTIAY